MNMFLDNFHQGGTYIAHIARHQVELRREGNLTYRKYLSITFLQTDYLNLDRSSGSGRNNERENIVNTKWNFCGGTNHYEDTCFKKIIKDKETHCVAGDLDRQRTERKTKKMFLIRICRSSNC